MKLHPRATDLTGNTYNRLQALSFAGYRNKKAYWKCICDCGAVLSVRRDHLTSGATQSCGCLNQEKRLARFITHGLSGTPIYDVYRAIWDRCTNKDNKGFPSYGGRGIKMCGRWLDSPQAFVDDMGPKPSPKHSVDRIDNDGDYSPENCRWATQTEQTRNTRNNRILTYRGVALPVATWGDIFGINGITVCKRLHRGWSVAKALETPLMNNKASKKS